MSFVFIAEYVYNSFIEHKMPIFKYFKTTYMKGGYESRRDRWALSHILRRGANFYVCGHQHLMAHMCLKAKPPKRPVEETNCNFVVMGCSSTLDNDPSEFEGDYEKTAKGDDNSGRCNNSNNNASSDGGGLPLNSSVDPELRTENTATTSASRYAAEWVCQGRLGFAVVSADKTACVMTFYAVDIGESGAYSKVHEVKLTK
jgi:hypothetical protein